MWQNSRWTVKTNTILDQGRQLPDQMSPSMYIEVPQENEKNRV